MNGEVTFTDLDSAISGTRTNSNSDLDKRTRVLGSKHFFIFIGQDSD